MNMAEIREKEILTVQESAALIGCSEPVIRNAIHHEDEERRLEASRIPGGSKLLIRRADLDAWIDRNRVSGKCEFRQTKKKPAVTA